MIVAMVVRAQTLQLWAAGNVTAISYQLIRNFLQARPLKLALSPWPSSLVREAGYSPTLSPLLIRFLSPAPRVADKDILEVVQTYLAAEKDIEI